MAFSLQRPYDETTERQMRSNSRRGVFSFRHRPVRLLHAGPGVVSPFSGGSDFFGERIVPMQATSYRSQGDSFRAWSRRYEVSGMMSQIVGPSMRVVKNCSQSRI